MVQHMPDGLDTWVHERGDNLSSGQKQMIAFARALALDPIYLLLDEATANIDLETEARIRAAMGRLLQGRTSIVIAHRLSTVLTADRILVMHKGRLAESGNHQELLTMRGLYWRLFQIQFGYQYEGAPATPEAEGSLNGNGQAIERICLRSYALRRQRTPKDPQPCRIRTDLHLDTESISHPLPTHCFTNWAAAGLGATPSPATHSTPPCP